MDFSLAMISFDNLIDRLSMFFFSLFADVVPMMGYTLISVLAR